MRVKKEKGAEHLLDPGNASPTAPEYSRHYHQRADMLGRIILPSKDAEVLPDSRTRSRSRLSMRLLEELFPEEQTSDSHELLMTIARQAT